MQVVICLEILTFERWLTTNSCNTEIFQCCDLLRNSYLWKVINNHLDGKDLPWRSCDLLRNSYLWKVINNASLQAKYKPAVVICLEILTFERWLTTVRIYTELLSRCDLLRNSYLWKVINNAAYWSSSSSYVVICLEILTFERWLTTERNERTYVYPLWFA